MLLKEPKMKDKRCNEEESMYGAGGPATLHFRASLDGS